MATAFREGLYFDKETELTFGSGKYGDLGALIAAMLLDRESRSVVLDADPTHGSLLEPLLKVVRVMKSLEFQRLGDTPIPGFNGILSSSAGQAPYELPNVFSFFLPDFQPSRGMLRISILLRFSGYQCLFLSVSLLLQVLFEKPALCVQSVRL